MVYFYRFHARRGILLHAHYITVDKESVALADCVFGADGYYLADTLLYVSQLQFFMPMPRNNQISQVTLMEAIRILYCHTLNDLNLIPVCLKSLHTLTGLVFIIGIIITHLEGIRIGKSKRVDFLLAVGGGSAIDTAKAIAYGLAEPEKDVWELFDHTRMARRCIPVASVLTIAAAGSETSKGCVITNEKTGEKRAYDDNLARPKFAIMNPEYMKSLPDYQTESGCTDIMMPVRKLCGRGALPIMTLPAAKKLNREDAIHIYQNARG